MTIFNILMEEAKNFEIHRIKVAKLLDNMDSLDWKYHAISFNLEKEIDILIEKYEDAWQKHEITNNEFNQLVLTICYDYPEDLKPDSEFDA